LWKMSFWLRRTWRRLRQRRILRGRERGYEQAHYGDSRNS
jgi:hypothetical protein